MHTATQQPETTDSAQVSATPEPAGSGAHTTGRERVFSGIQPSGTPHIGNYLGAIRHWVAEQDIYDNVFCVVNLHAITVPQDPDELRDNTRQLAAVLLACGLDPKRSALFIQSQVTEHAELAWILNCFTPMGWLNRMTQFKSKAGDERETVSAGLFDYPVLMAADILLYQTDAVPVGDDQRQHVELTRDLANSFNFRFGTTFVEPRALIREVGARIMALDDPERKMSKSDAEGSYIALLDPPDVVRKKIARATTDSERTIVFDEKPTGYLQPAHDLSIDERSELGAGRSRVRGQRVQGLQGGAQRPGDRHSGADPAALRRAGSRPGASRRAAPRRSRESAPNRRAYPAYGQGQGRHRVELSRTAPGKVSIL